MTRIGLVGLLVGLIIVAVIAPGVVGGVAGTYGMMGSGGMMGSVGMAGSGAMSEPGMMPTPASGANPDTIATDPHMTSGAANQPMAGSGWTLGVGFGLFTMGRLAFWGALLVGLALLADWVRQVPAISGLPAGTARSDDSTTAWARPSAESVRVPTATDPTRVERSNSDASAGDRSAA